MKARNKSEQFYLFATTMLTVFVIMVMFAPQIYDTNFVFAKQGYSTSIHLPVNVCGNAVNPPAGLNPAFGNTCINE